MNPFDSQIHQPLHLSQTQLLLVYRMRSPVISLIVAFFVLRALSAPHRENRARGLKPRQGEPIDTFTLTGYSPGVRPFYPSYNLSLPEDTLKLTSISASSPFCYHKTRYPSGNRR